MTSNVQLADIATCLYFYKLQQNRAIGVEYVTAWERGLLQFSITKSKERIKPYLEGAMIKAYLDKANTLVRKLMAKCDTPEMRQKLFPEIQKITNDIELATERLQECQKSFMN